MNVIEVITKWYLAINEDCRIDSFLSIAILYVKNNTSICLRNLVLCAKR